MVRALYVLVSLLLLPSVAAAIPYDFESLTPGQSLFGQDNWQASGSSAIQVTTGTGINTTQVIQGANGNFSDGLRLNDVAFNIPTFDDHEPLVIVDVDFRLGTSIKVNAGIGRQGGGGVGIARGPTFGLRQVSGVDVFNFITPQGGFDVDSPLATANGGASAGSDTDWFRMRMVADFTGNGVMSLSYMNLTLGESSFTPIAGLQNIGLNIINLINSSNGPSTWNGLVVQAHSGAEIDNIGVSAPEPSATLLLATAALGLGLRSRRKG